MSKLKVINLFAGPGAGKSTVAAELFAGFKRRGLCAELVTEYAKEVVWDNALHILDRQDYVFAKQNYRLARLVGKVDVVITDGPIMLSCVYSNSKNLSQLVREAHDKYDNINFFLERTKHYEPRGRMQTEEGAISLDKAVRHMLINNGLGFEERQDSALLADEIVEELMPWVSNTEGV